MARLTYEEWKKENWDRAHSENDLTALTGTSLGGHLNTLHAAEFVTPDASVLCVGVGTGGWIAELIPKVGAVCALDVTLLAGQCLPTIVPLFTNPRRLPLDCFDLALSLWVTPHMNDHDLQEQLGGIVRSLKSGGVLAMHHKEPLDKDQAIDNCEGTGDEWRVARAAGMLRTREGFAAMVDRAGGRVLRVADEQPSQFHRVIEVSVHIGRKE